MPLPVAIPALVTPPWLLPFVAGARAVVRWLEKLRITVNGVVVASLVAAALAGGWWIARQARINAVADRIAEETRITAAVNRRLADWVAHKRGEISADDDRVRAIQGDLRRLLDALPVEVEVHTERVFVPVSLPVVTPAAPVAGRPAAPAAPRMNPGSCAEYSDQIRAKLNEINVR